MTRFLSFLALYVEVNSTGWINKKLIVLFKVKDHSSYLGWTDKEAHNIVIWLSSRFCCKNPLRFLFVPIPPLRDGAPTKKQSGRDREKSVSFLAAPES